MTVRAIQSRVDCDRETLEKLWNTHRVFNERLPIAVATLLRMRKGESGATPEEQRLISAFAKGVLMLDAKNAYDPLLKSARSTERDGTARGQLKRHAEKALKRLDAEQAKPPGERDCAVVESSEATIELCRDYESAFDLFRSGVLPLADLFSSLKDLPNMIARKVIQDSVEHIRSHLALVDLWEKDHAAWLDRRAKWEAVAEHQLYLAIRPQFDEFERAVGGRITKRRGRWHLYLDWLKSNPGLAGWRGGEPCVNDIPEEGMKRIAKARPNRKRGVEAEEFWAVNPELEALDKLHGTYEREFVRRRKTKKNHDGFDHRPTLTLPSPVKHPRWIVFSGPQTSPSGYRNLLLPARHGTYGAIDLLTGEREGGKEKYVSVRLRTDPRLSLIEPVTRARMVTRGKDAGVSKESNSYRFFDPRTRKWRDATISGVKLIFRQIKVNPDGSLKSAVPYLVFTVDIASDVKTEAAGKIKWIPSKTASGRGRYQVPDGTISCAVDLGIRHLGFATLARLDANSVQILRSRNLWITHIEESGRHPGRVSPGPTLDKIRRDKRTLRIARRKRGKPVRGERSHVELQSHVTHLGQDRFKKGARKIIDFALGIDTEGESARADVLLVESLAGMIPDAERERGINSSLIEFNRAQLVERIEQAAEDAGLRLISLPPYGTSQVCSRCGSLGRRYSIGKNRESGVLEVKFGFVEKLFACPDCGYRANSDHNASCNLHRRFLLGEKAIESYAKFRGMSKADQSKLYSEMESSLRVQLIMSHSCPLPF